MPTIFLLLLLLFAKPGPQPLKVSYRIDEKSQLTLSGKTNIDNYSCNCSEKFPAAVLEAEINPANGFIQFGNASLLVRTKQLDCNDFIITHYMHKSLGADKYPTIQVQFVAAQPLHSDKQLMIGKTYQYNVTAIISIAGVSKTHLLNVQLTRLSKQGYKLVSSKELTMSEFNIRVRSPFNIVKAEDKVLIRFAIQATTGI